MIHSKKKITSRFYSYFYLGTGLVIAGLIFLLFSTNISVRYSVYMGYEYSFKWRDDGNYYQYLGVGAIPQGLVGLQLDLPIRFTEDTDQGFSIHLYLLPENEDILYYYTGEFPDLIPELRMDLTPELLSSYAVFKKIIDFDTQGTERLTISINFPSDNAYSVAFLADPFAINGNLTGTVIVDNYFLHGIDQKGVQLGTALLGSGILLWGVIICYSVVIPTLQPRPLKNKEEKSSLNSLLIEIKALVEENNNSSDHWRYQNFLTLLKYEIQQLFGSPFIIIFIPFIAFILTERFREVFHVWEPLGGYAFGEFGTTISAQGITIFIIELILVLAFVLLFLFRDQDEGLHKIRLALPFKRNEYLLVKAIMVLIPTLILCLSYVGGTFVLIPLRNQAIIFQPLSRIWAPFLAYGLLTITLAVLGYSSALIMRNSRFSLLILVGIFIFWFYTSIDLQAGILSYSESYAEAPHLQETINSHFSLLSPERVIEFFLLRPITPSWGMENRLLYLHDTVMNPLIVLGFYLFVATGCTITAILIFRRRDL